MMLFKGFSSFKWELEIGINQGHCERSKSIAFWRCVTELVLKNQVRTDSNLTFSNSYVGSIGVSFSEKRNRLLTEHTYPVRSELSTFWVVSPLYDLYPCLEVNELEIGLGWMLRNIYYINIAYVNIHFEIYHKYKIIKLIKSIIIVFQIRSRVKSLVCRKCC